MALSATAARWIAGLAGVGLLVAGWLVPAQLASVQLRVLEASGRGTRSLGALAADLEAAGRVGAALVVRAGEAAAERQLEPSRGDRAGETDRAGRPAVAGADLPERGMDDPILVLALGRAGGRPEAGVPALTELMTAAARREMTAFLRRSSVPAVAAVLATRDLPAPRHFLPVASSGGAPLEAAILATGVLLQGDRLHAELAREVRVAATAATGGDPRAASVLEDFYLGLVAVLRRHDWAASLELLARFRQIADLTAWRERAGAAGGKEPLMYAAAVLHGDPAAVVEWLEKARPRPARVLDASGEAGPPADAWSDLARASLAGEGAVKLLLERGRPVDTMPRPVPAGLASWTAASPEAALAARITVLALGAVLFVFAVLPGAPTLFLPVLATAVACLAFVAGEPWLRLAETPASPAPRLRIAAGGPGEAPAAAAAPATLIPMNPSGLVTLAVFVALQVAVFLLCLRKIAEIRRAEASPLLKLRLLENEDNLFDLGLYIGIGGTAFALMLQVLQVVEHNLLAAYSSNLLGILGVATVKIRHVRPLRRELLVASLEPGVAGAPSVPAAGAVPGAVR